MKVRVIVALAILAGCYGPSASPGDGRDNATGGEDAGGDAFVPPDAPWLERSFGENPFDDVQGVTQDATLDSTSPQTQLGQEATLRVATEASGARTAILSFVVRAVEPAAVVTRASLSLSVVEAPVASQLRFRALREPWSEFAATWFSEDGETSWPTAGGRPPGSSGEAWEVVVGPVLAHSELVVDVPVAIVQGWVADSRSNFGIVLELTGQGADELVLAAHEHPTMPRPSLTIAYTF